MTLAAAEKAVRAYEAMLARLDAAAASRAGLSAALGAQKMAALAAAFGGAEKVEALVAALPKSPAPADVVNAFDSPAQMAKLVNGALGGSPALLGTLAEKGCKRDLTKLKALAAEFDADPAPLKALVEEGGLAGHPEAFAALFEGGCDADPAQLRTLCGKFPDKPSREKLGGVLGAGGLGTAPALGPLAKEGGGDMLKRVADSFASPQDLKKLQSLVTEGGLGGGPTARPGRLADIVRDGLGGDPARLKDLHDAFKVGMLDDLAGLSTLVTGLEGKDADNTGGNPGEKLATLLDTFTRTNPGQTQAQIAAKLRDPFLGNLQALSATKASPLPKESRLDGPMEAANLRAAPAKAAALGPVSASIDRDGAARLLGGTGSPADRAAFGEALEGSAIARGRALAIAPGPAPGGADAARTAATLAAAKAATDAAAALDALPGAAPAAALVALGALAAKALDAAEAETDGPACTAALQAAKTAADAIDAAARRTAAAVLSAAGPAFDTVAALADSAARATDPAAKAALQEISAAAAEATAARLAAAADPAAAALAAKTARIDILPGPQQAAETDRLKKAAEAAAAAAAALGLEVKGSPRPLPPALAKRAAAAATAAARAGEASPDAGAAGAAFAAAKALADDLATAAKAEAAAADLARTAARAEGREGLNAATAADMALKSLALQPGGAGPAAARLTEAAKAARGAALTAADAVELEGNAVAAKAAAKDAARRKAAEALAPGTAPADLAVTQAEAAANAAAQVATAAAEVARAALAAGSPADADFDTKTAEAARKAEDALKAAALAPDDAIRAAGLAKAKETAALVARAAIGLAKAQMPAVSTALDAESRTKQRAMAVPRRNALAVHKNGASSAGQKKAASVVALGALDASRRALTDQASARLAQLAMNDVPTLTAEADLAEKAAAAAAPGARGIASVKAALAERDYREKLADAAKAALMGPALPVVPANGAPIGSVSPQTLRQMTTLLKATETALADWTEAALRAFRAATELKRQLDAIPARTAEEDADRTAVQAILDNNPKAEDEWKRAVTAQGSIEARAEDMSARAADLATWINRNHGPAKVPVPAPIPQEVEDVQAAAVMMKTVRQEVAVTLGPNQTVPKPLEETIRIGATMERDPYAGGAVANVKIDHIEGRHNREHFMFEGDSLPQAEEHALGLLVEADMKGRNLNGAPFATEKALVRLANTDKPSSLFPEGTNVRALTAQALVALGSPPPTGVNLLANINAAPGQYLKRPENLVGPPPIQVLAGAGLDTGGQPILIQMFPTAKGDRVAMSDLQTIGRALGRT